MLDLTPINLDEANAFVAAHHRHHKPVPGAKFCLAVSEGDKVRGVAIVGRPVARLLDNGWTLEVNRVCTDGARNACSMLYGSCLESSESPWLPATDYLHAAGGRRRKPAGERVALHWPARRRDMGPAEQWPAES